MRQEAEKKTGFIPSSSHLEIYGIFLAYQKVNIKKGHKLDKISLCPFSLI
jgi:hypothetical protein